MFDHVKKPLMLAATATFLTQSLLTANAASPAPPAGARSAAGSAVKTASADWNPLLKNAWQLSLSSETQAANAKAQEALDIAEKKLDAKGILACLDTQADLLDAQGDIAGQEAIRKRALELAETKFGKSSPEYARHLAKMASWHARKGEQGEARNKTDEAMGILGNSASKYPHEMAVCQLATARRLFSEGSFGLADDAFSKALQMQDNSGSPELFETLQICREYSTLLDQLGRKPEAEKLKDRINLVKAGSGLSDPGKKSATATGAASSDFLKLVQQAKLNSGDRAKCMASWKQALQEAEKSGNDKKIAFVLVHLSDEYRFTKQDDESVTLLKRALSLREKAGAAETLGMARNMTRLAQIYMSTGKGAEAESLLRKASDIESKCSASDAMRGTTLQYLISAAMVNKNNRQAEDAARQLITVSDKQSGGASAMRKRLAQSMLGSIYMQTGRMNEGMQIMKDVSSNMGSTDDKEITKIYTDEFNECDKLVDDSELKEFS